MPGLIPLIGEKFPEMVVETSHGTKKLPDDYKGKWLVLFSHPADFTPVCTTEFVAFAKRYEDFKKLDTELLGLSVDSTYSHIKWVEWIEKSLGVRIPFPIIADPGGEVSRKLGFLHAQSATHTVRSVIIVDPEGTIRAILYYPQEVGRNMDEILRLIDALQTADKYKVATPANWRPGDPVIIPPPTTQEEAEKRLQEAAQQGYECIDWYFCKKKLP